MDTSTVLTLTCGNTAGTFNAKVTGTSGSITHTAQLSVTCTSAPTTTTTTTTWTHYSFTVSDGTYSNGVWVVPPNVAETLNASTTDQFVTKITVSGTSNMGGTLHFYCTGTPVLTCSQAFWASYFPAGDQWDITVTFYRGSATAYNVKAAIYPSIFVTPEFPVGAMLAVLAPMLALLGYARFRRPRI